MTAETGVVTPCKHCGAPIQQRQGRGRPKLTAQKVHCQAAAKRERELRRATPGLEGALARAEQLYEADGEWARLGDRASRARSGR